MTNMNDGCTDSQSLTNKMFIFGWTGFHALGVSEIWPDGDAPENPTVDDVIEVIRTCGGVSDVLRNWNLPPQLEVDGRVVQ